VLRLIAVPYAYVQIRDYAWQLGRTPPTVIQLIEEILPALLSRLRVFRASIHGVARPRRTIETVRAGSAATMNTPT
jgi:hypothetical protein